MKKLSFLLLLVIAACASNPGVQESNNQKAAPETIATEVMPVKVETQKVTAGEIKCTYGDSVRTIRVEKTSPHGCEVIYNKDGQNNLVASAKSDLSHCDKVRDQIKSNLTTFGYICQ